MGREITEEMRRMVESQEERRGVNSNSGKRVRVPRVGWF